MAPRVFTLILQAPFLNSGKCPRYTDRCTFDQDIFGPESFISTCVHTARGMSNEPLARAWGQCLQSIIRVFICFRDCIGKPAGNAHFVLPLVKRWSNDMWHQLGTIEKNMCRCAKCADDHSFADDILACANAAEDCAVQLQTFVCEADPSDRCSLYVDMKSFKGTGKKHVSCAAIGEGPEHAAFGLTNGTVRVWTGARKFVSLGMFPSAVEAVSFSPDYLLVIARSKCGVVKVWNVTNPATALRTLF